MDDPVFRLEGVIRTRSETEDFIGPLSLILQLLSKNKIEIEDISVSLILDQYLEYLDQMAAMDLDIASEFVAMASHLTYIKSKMLLAGGEEVSELEELISSLEELRRKDEFARVRSVTDRLAQMYKRGSGLIPKPPEYIEPDREYKYSHEVTDIYDAFMRVIDRDREALAGLTAPSVPMPSRIVYSVSSKAGEIMERLNSPAQVRVRALFEDCRSRSEMVATLIALLELCKLGSILISGEGSAMTVSRTGSTSAEPDFAEYESEGEQ